MNRIEPFLESGGSTPASFATVYKGIAYKIADLAMTDT